MRIKILRANRSGLVVLLRTKLFDLSVPEEEIFQFYLWITLIFILPDWNIFLWIKNYFLTSKWLLSPSGLLIRKILYTVLDLDIILFKTSSLILPFIQFHWQLEASNSCFWSVTILFRKYDTSWIKWSGMNEIKLIKTQVLW